MQKIFLEMGQFTNDKMKAPAGGVYDGGKKVLVIAYHYPPIRASSDRTYHFTKYLPEFGWNPFVLTVDKPRWRDSSDYTYEIPRNVRVFRTRAIKNLCTAGLSVAGLLPYTDIWVPFAYKEGLKIIRENGIDVIYSSSPSPSSHILGYLLKKKTCLPLVLDYRDPWYHPALWGWLHREILQSADKVITVTEGYKEIISAQADHLEDVEIIPNGIDLQSICEIRSEEPEKFTIVYAGVLWPFNRLKGLVEAVSLIDDKESIKLTIVGGRYGKLKRYSDKLNVDVNFTGRLPHEKSMEIVSKASVGYEGVSFSGAIPGKVYEYLAFGKPIIALTTGDIYLEKFILENRVGMCARTVKELAEKIEFLYKDRNRLKKFSKNALEIAKKYDRRDLARELVIVLDGLKTK